MRDFTETRKALAAYDEKLALFNSEHFSRMRNGEAWKFFDEMEEMGHAVRRAFIAATSDVNSPDKVKVVGLEFIRKMVSR